MSEFKLVDGVKSYQLCRLCRQIDFQLIFRTLILVQQNWPQKISFSEHQKGKRDGDWFAHIFLGYLDQIWRNGEVGCAFCRLVKQAFILHYKNTHLPPSIWQEGTINGERIECILSNDKKELSTEGGPRNGPPTYILEVQTRFRRPDLATGFDVSSAEDIPPRIQLLIPTSSSPESRAVDYHWGRTISSQVDPTLLKRWVHMCEKYHPNVSVKVAEALSTDVPEIRVIDVVRRCIVRIRLNTRYVALSYVWGKAQPIILKKNTINSMQTDGSLSNDDKGPSQTIKDAIILTHMLGEQYLWVDALCIIQDDDTDKAIQIGMMDRIYTSAILTIAAAWGENTEAGMPGVRPKSRETGQYIEEINGLKLASVLPRKEVIESSKWNSRAWTYQERTLSNRMLFFTANQAQFICPRGCEFREDSFAENQPQEEIEESTKLNEIATAVGTSSVSFMILDEETNFDIYANIVTRYTTRSMTDPRDGLSAFSGIAQILLPLFRVPCFVFGLPATFLDIALLWKPRGLLNRRRDPKSGKALFPSWCWAGWEGTVEYPELLNICETTASMINLKPTDFDDELNNDEDTQFQPFPGKLDAPWSGWKSWRRCYDEDTTAIYYIDAAHSPDIRYGRPILDIIDEPHQAKEFLQHAQKTSQLRFHARSAYFTLNGEHSRLHSAWKGHRPDCETLGKHVRCDLAMLDEDGITAGTVFVDGNTVNRLLPLLPGNYEFIALSQSTLYTTDADTSWQESTREFLHSLQDCRTTPAQPANDDNNDDSDESTDWDEPPLKIVEEGREKRVRDRYFDSSKYDRKKYWCLYNVLLVERKGEDGDDDGVMTAQRLGIGRVNVDAFDRIAEQKFVILT
ncbi:MAG: hypothetical protein M1834_008221 [Cirrosporium novae-zelandiae]|nr:MAG: hypothetical protein M1834_008221 [Cirrosporium novae-zelandiae]